MVTHSPFPLPMLLLLVAAIVSCKAADSTGDVIRPRLSIPGMSAADYYPLANGWKWEYSVWKDGRKTPMLHAVLAQQGDVVVVQEGDEQITYVVGPDGVAEKDGDKLGDYIIKNPIAAGAEWPVAGGRARIASVDGKFAGPLVGAYEGCVLIAVTRTDPNRVTQTLFAPYLGPVLMDIQADVGSEFLGIAHAELVRVTRPGEAATP